MSDAPETIWIDGAVTDNRWHEHETDCTLSGVAAVEYSRSDLAPTTAQIMAHPKVQALVEALGDCCEELEQAQLSQIAAKHFALAELARIACDNARAALAALEDKP